jgi:hypothetical protein
MKCNIPLRGRVLGLCLRPGASEFGGRCWQHRAASSGEQAHAKRLRIAKHDESERAMDVTTAKRVFGDVSQSLVESLIDAHRAGGTLALPLDLQAKIATAASARDALDRAREAAENARVTREAIELSDS